MNSDSQFMIVLPDGRRFGPASIDVLEAWAREGRIPVAASIEPTDGSAPARPVMAEPRLAAIIGTPPTVAGPVVAPTDEGVSALIPYKNGPALASYYVSVASLIPGIGLILGPIAIGLGIAGIRKYNRKPAVKGIAHAWVGIILGSICFIGYASLVALAIVGAFVG